MYSIDEMVKKLRPDIILERLPPYHCELNAIELVQAIPKDEVRKTPFKNVHDVKTLAHRAFKNVTPDVVRNCYDHVKKQEDFYRQLHKLEPLPVEDIEESATEIIDESCILQSEEGLIFSEEGQIMEQNMEEIEFPRSQGMMLRHCYCDIDRYYFTDMAVSFERKIFT